MKLFFSFLIFLGITFLVILTGIWFRAKEKRMQKTIDMISSVNAGMQNAQKLELIFFNDESINENFYKTGNSEILNKRKKETEKIRKRLDILQKTDEIQSPAFNHIILNLTQKFNQHEKIFSNLTELVKKRGFKGYGIEGEMRDRIHNIENSGANFNLAQMLLIRRHEKDYIIRKQKDYVKKLTDAVEVLRKNIAGQNELLNQLNRYEQNFLELVALEEKIGFDNRKGLKGIMTTLTGDIEKAIDELNKYVFDRVEESRSQNDMIQFCIIAGCLAVILFLTYFISRDIGKPITKLSNSIQEVIDSNFSETVRVIPIVTRDEIGLLSNSVDYMIKTVQSNIKELRDKNEQIEKKQQAIMESVIYAERIQKSLLQEQELQQHFEKYFVIYQPKYEVSGDFYWIKKVEEQYICAVLDCKGIGLSGAIMTMIVNTLINQIVISENITEPESILEALDREIKSAIPQGYMKACFCCIENIDSKPSFKRVTYAGAGIPLFFSNGLQLSEIEASKRIIGIKQSDFVSPFKSHTFEIHESELLYLTTDGYINQIDKDDTYFAWSVFKEIIQNNIHQHIPEQEKSLQNALNIYLKDKSQKDDITILGIKLHLKNNTESKDKRKRSLSVS